MGEGLGAGAVPLPPARPPPGGGNNNNFAAHLPGPLLAPSRARSEGRSHSRVEARPPLPRPSRSPPRPSAARSGGTPLPAFPPAPAALPAGGREPRAARWPLRSRRLPGQGARPAAAGERQPKVTGPVLAAGGRWRSELRLVLPEVPGNTLFVCLLACSLGVF